MQEFLCLRKPLVILGADHPCIDASARQNAEQQLSQAAELNFVSRSQLFGVMPKVSVPQIEG